MRPVAPHTPRYLPRYMPSDETHRLATLDPGKYRCGMSMWDVSPVGETGLYTTKLAWTSLIKSRIEAIDELLYGSEKPIMWVLEDPQKYNNRTATHRNLEGLFKINRAVAALARRRGERCMKIKPVSWKGNVPKPIHHQRCEALMRDGEWWVHQKDVADALALGLYISGRSGIGGTSV